jgi:hypothetical protein
MFTLQRSLLPQRYVTASNQSRHCDLLLRPPPRRHPFIERRAEGHRRIKRLARPELGPKSFVTTLQRIAGYEVMVMIGKG